MIDDLKRIVFQYMYKYPLICASYCGHTAIVKLMLPVSNPKAKDIYGNITLMQASENGHTEIVKLFKINNI